MPLRHRLCATLLLAGCFADIGTDRDDDQSSTSSDADTSSAADPSTSSASGSGSMSGGATTQLPDDSSTTNDGSEASASEASSDESSTTASSTDTGDEPFCDAQPADVVVCYDFDGAGPFAGANLWEDHGTVDTTEARAVSAPRSMEVVAIGDPVGVTNVSLGRTLAGVPLPFDGELAVEAFLESACFPGGVGQQRLVAALQFWDDAAPDGPFLLNFTLWITATGATLYVSDEGQGFPSAPYPLDLAFPLDAWVHVAIAFDATDDLATVTLGDDTDTVQVDIITPTVTGEIVGVAPSISIGTAMQPGDPGCTMWFDNVTVTAS